MNDKELYRRKALKTSLVGIVSYIVICLIGRTYWLIRKIFFEEKGTSNLSSVYLIVIFFSFALYFLPLVRRIHFYAKKAEDNRIRAAANIVTVFILIILSFVLIIWAKGMHVIR